MQRKDIAKLKYENSRLAREVEELQKQINSNDRLINELIG